MRGHEWGGLAHLPAKVRVIPDTADRQALPVVAGSVKPAVHGSPCSCPAGMPQVRGAHRWPPEIQSEKGETVNKKALTVLTVAAMVMGILLVGSGFFLLAGDAPHVRMTLYDTDGVKTVSTGETAEYLILIRNTGSATGHFGISEDSSARGWERALSHESVHLGSGEEQFISLFVTPVTRDAEASITVNVMATRGDNVTMVSTTTFLKGTVEILKPGETAWRSFDADTDVLAEGDQLRSAENSYAQVSFPGGCRVTLHPRSHLYVRWAHTTAPDGAATLQYHLHQGVLSSRVKLSHPDSIFTLDLASGAAVVVDDHEVQTVFRAAATGYVRVFEGQVGYVPAPGTRQGGDHRSNITRGMDSDGEDFVYAVLTYDRDSVSGILSNVKGEKIGFDNTGAFVADGNLGGFVFREPGRDIYYLEGLDTESITLDIATIPPGTFGLTFHRYSPDLRGFVFRRVDTPAEGTARFVFKGDRVEVSSSSRLDYDFEIHYRETDRFFLTEMTLFPGQGNSFTVLNYIHLKNNEVNSVRFELDENGDGKTDKTLLIRNGMTGNEVYHEIDTDDGSGLVVLLLAIAIILIILGMILILKMAPPGSMERAAEDGPEGEPGTGTAHDLAGVRDTEDEGETEATDERDVPGGADMTSVSHPGVGLAVPPDMEGEGPAGGMLPSGAEEPGEEDDVDRTGEEDRGTGMFPGTEPSTFAEDLMARKEDQILREEYEPLPGPEEKIPPPPDGVIPELLGPEIPRVSIKEKTAESGDDDGSFRPPKQEGDRPGPDDERAGDREAPEAGGPDGEPGEDLDERPGEGPHEGSDMGSDEDQMDAGKEPEDELEAWLPLDLDLFPEEERIVPPPQRPPHHDLRPDTGPTEGEDGIKRYEIGEIQRELERVREMKHEMQSLEGISAERGWWNDWNARLKREIDSLVQDTGEPSPQDSDPHSEPPEPDDLWQ